MKKITFDQPHYLSKLHDELLAAIPQLQPVEVDGERWAVVAVGGDGQTLTLRVPDSADEAAIRAVVEAHDPTPPAPPPDPQAELAAAIEAVDTTTISDPAAAAAIEQLKAALLGQANRAGRVAARTTGGENAPA